MSAVRVYMACSLDGFIAGPGDDLSFLHEPPHPDQVAVDDPGALQFAPFLAQVGAMIMGRRTYDVVAAMDVDWPYGELPVLVTTRRPLTPVVSTIRSIAGDINTILDHAQDIAGGQDVYLDGGDVIRQALNAGRVDEMCITIVPTLLGGGIRLFGGLVHRSRWSFVGHHRLGHLLQVNARSVSSADDIQRV